MLMPPANDLPLSDVENALPFGSHPAVRRLEEVLHRLLAFLTRGLRPGSIIPLQSGRLFSARRR
jgi:hypothetical protein